jgi:hypothetical protein
MAIVKQGINKAKSFKIGIMWKNQHIVGLLPM